MLFKLSFKNMRRSLKDYTIYFLTLILGIAIFYVFNAIDSQTAFIHVSSSTADALVLLTDIIFWLSVFVACVLGFLVVYASRFLMRRRHREFALYMTLGMRKANIAGILGIETLLIGIFSLAIGLIIGIGLSQVMSAIVVQLFEADMTEFTFLFSESACLKTILFFVIIMAVVLLFDLYMVGKSSLLQLMQTGSRSEKVHMKKPAVCIVVFILSALLLAAAYIMITDKDYMIITAEFIYIPIIAGIIATFFLFWSVSGFLLGLFSASKKHYQRGLNCFTFRQISSRINTMTASLTVICVLLFFTIALLATTLSLRSSLNQSAKELTPVDIMVGKFMATKETFEEWMKNYRDDYPEDVVEEEISADVMEMIEQADSDLLKDLCDIVPVYFYTTYEYTIGDALGDVLQEALGSYPNLLYDARQPMITESDYNKVAALYGMPSCELSEDEYLLLCNAKQPIPYWDKMMAGGKEITVFGHTLHPAEDRSRYGFIELSAQHENTGITIIPDAAADAQYRSQSLLIANYRASDDVERQQAETRIIEKIQEMNRASCTQLMFAQTKIDILGSVIGLGALATFIGLYLGMVFLVAAAAILALKALSDSIDSKGRYTMLRQLGAEEKDIRKSLFKQQIMLFLFPLVLACIHVVFAMIFAQTVLTVIGTSLMADSILMTAVVTLVIYGAYFLLTYISSKKIIQKD